MGHELDDETLHAYFDGELPEEKRALVRTLLESSEGLRARLARLERTRDFVRMGAAEQVGEVDADALFARVEQGVSERADAGFGEPFSVVDGGRASVPPVERWKVSVPIVATLAAAAAALLVVVGRPSGSEHGAVVPDAPAPTLIEGPQGSEVEEVDFGANTGTVFAVKGELGEPLAVVWLSDEGGTP